jgi:hypothetical protein
MEMRTGSILSGAVENGSAGVLHAYDPADLAHEYYQARNDLPPPSGNRWRG